MQIRRLLLESGRRRHPAEAHGLVSFALTARVLLSALAASGQALGASEVAPAHFITFTAESASVHVYRPDEPVAYLLEVAAPPGKAGMHLQLSQSSLDLRESDRSFDLLAGRRFSLRVVANSPSLGWHELSAKVTTAEGIVLDAVSQSFVVSPPVKSTGAPFHFGVSSHWTWAKGADYARELELADRLGIDMIRDGAEWHDVQPTPETWDFGKFDAVVDAMAQRKIQVEAVLAFTAQWASTGDPAAKDWLEWGRKKPRLEPWLNFVKTSVLRYRGRVRYWEIWNEPDIQNFWHSSSEDYVQLFNTTSQAIKQTVPEDLVLNGGLAMARQAPHADMLDRFVAGASDSNWDIRAYHDYFGFDNFLRRWDEHQRLYANTQHGQPIWINEGGFHVLVPDGPRRQAIDLVKKISTAQAFGAGAYLWYNLRDKTRIPTDVDGHLGLATIDFQPRPAYAAYQRLIAEIGGKKYIPAPSARPANGLWAHYFSDGSANVMVLWREGDNRRCPVWLSLGNRTMTAALDLMGNVIRTVPLASGAVVEVSSEPIYLHFSGEATCPAMFPMVSTPECVAARGAQSVPVSITVINPTAGQINLAASLQTDVRAFAVSDSQPVRLAAGQSSQLTFNLRASQPGIPKRGQLTVQLRGDAAALPIEASIAYESATTIPAVALDHPALPPGQGLVYTLDTIGSVHNLFSADGDLQKLWKGPSDLSAQAFIAHDAHYLYLTVAVTDDSHHQPVSGADIWQGDSLQFGVQMPSASAGYLEAGIALGDDGKPQGWIYSVHHIGTLKVGPILDRLPYSITRKETQTLYQVAVPWKAVGLTGTPTSALRLSFLVNDDDGFGRKQWICLSDGMGLSKDPGRFPLFCCDP